MQLQIHVSRLTRYHLFVPDVALASNSLVTHSRGGGPVKSGSGVDFLELGTGLSAGSQNFANLN